MIVLPATFKTKSFPLGFSVILGRLLTIKRVAITPTVAELLSRKQQLVERLHEERRLHEQDEIERLLASINAMLNRLDGMPIEATPMRH